MLPRSGPRVHAAHARWATHAHTELALELVHSEELHPTPALAHTHTHTHTCTCSCTCTCTLSHAHTSEVNTQCHHAHKLQQVVADELERAASASPTRPRARCRPETPRCFIVASFTSSLCTLSRPEGSYGARGRSWAENCSAAGPTLPSGSPTASHMLSMVSTAARGAPSPGAWPCRSGSSAPAGEEPRKVLDREGVPVLARLLCGGEREPPQACRVWWTRCIIM